MIVLSTLQGYRRRLGSVVPVQESSPGVNETDVHSLFADPGDDMGGGTDIPPCPPPGPRSMYC